MKTIGTVFWGALLIAGAANATTIVGYALAGHPGNLTVTSADSSVTASNISFGLGASEYGIGTQPAGLGLNVSGAATTEATAVSTSSYFQFTVMPKAGYDVSFSSLTFDVESGASNDYYFIRSSADNYVSDVQHPVSESAGYHPTVPISLSAASFQDLAGPVTFRFYGLSNGGSPTGVVFIQNLSVNGSEVFTTPEPSSLYLMLLTGFAAAFIALRRRRVPAA